MENQKENRKGNWMISYKGNKLFPLDLRPEDIDIEEIAHSLSNLCRFGGHCKFFYSVAQHSVLVSSLLPDDLKLVGLLHDATEAYCGDMVRPLKKSIPQFDLIETNIWTTIALKYNLPMNLPERVCLEDARALLAEKKSLLVNHKHEWEFPQCAYPDLEPANIEIFPWSPFMAEGAFLDEFEVIMSRRNLNV